MFGLLFIALGIWLVVHNNSIRKNNPLYVGQIIDISPRPLSFGKYGTRNPFIVRVIINGQPIITSTLTTTNCFWGLKSSLESKKRTYVGRIVHIYFNHQYPCKSVIKEFDYKNIIGYIILFTLGPCMIFAELMVTLAILFSITGVI